MEQMGLYVIKGLLSLCLYLGAHFATAFALVRWGRKYFGRK